MRYLITIVAVLLVAGIAVFIWKKKSGAATQPRFSNEEYHRHYEVKQAALERVLGPMRDLVGHAIIPFQVGGAVDMYYFPNGIEGTGFATMELIEPDGSGPKPNRIGTYELVAFTRHSLTVEELDVLGGGVDPIREEDKAREPGPFDKIERRLCGILTSTGRYSYDAVLNPGDTCEIPGKEGEPTICLIFDEYSPDGIRFEINGRRHCLLLVLEVFRSEMEHAMEHGSAAVLQKLKERGHYPYSDLDREPVF